MRFSPDKMQKNELFSSPQIEADLFCLEPGQVQRPQKFLKSDRIYFILEGIGRFTIGRATRELRSGTAVVVPAGNEHGVVNMAEERLTLLVTTAPPEKPAA